MEMGFIMGTIVIKTANYRSVFSCFLVPEFFSSLQSRMRVIFLLVKVELTRLAS